MSHDPIASFVAASRAAQGLPPTVEDQAVLRRIAALMTENQNRQATVSCSTAKRRPGPIRATET